jgi:predicted phage baseplate assembly protein
VHRDYASNAGTTLRFGDGEFGQIPKKETVFRVDYRLGIGRLGNVAADTLIHFDSSAPTMPFCVELITNPLPATNGEDPETTEQIRQLAPGAFRAVPYRAVRPEDYAEAAARLPWVQQAGATRRWTGSWLTTFVTADPRGAVSIDDTQYEELSQQIDRFRQTGHEACAERPRYVDIDLEITVCAAPDAYRGDVKARVLGMLLGKPGRPGFFSPDNFTFGTPLRRSKLEAAIQEVPGVRAVEGIRIRRRGFFDWQALTGPYLPVGDSVVLRLLVEGGA